MKKTPEEIASELYVQGAPAIAALADTNVTGVAAIDIPPGKESTFGWINHVTRYQWLVLMVAWLGWVFDAMDGTLYSLVQKPSITALLGPGATEASIGFYSSVVFSAMLIGWAMGGIVFGVLADYMGRTKALLATILIYSLFTGLSAISFSWWQLAGYRFLTGLGLGGEWAAGAALVAEVWPDKLRARAGAMLQSAAAVGFFLAAVVNLWVGEYSWRYVYLVGAIPAVLVLFLRTLVNEPDKWTAANEQRKLRKESARREPAKAIVSEADKFTLKQLFGPTLRKDTLVASTLAFVVLLAVWGATMWVPAVIRELAAAASPLLSGPALQRHLSQQASYGIMLLNAGSLFGCLLFGPLADRLGRKATFLIYFVGGLIIFPVTFLVTAGLTRLFLLLPIVGFFSIGATSGFPIYLPELFPTRVRTTGVGFCYNLGRVVTAGGVFLTGYLVGFFGSYSRAVTAVSLVYLIGIVASLVARETRGQKLDET